MILSHVLIILYLCAMNFCALCDGIRGLLFLMLFENPFILLGWLWWWFCVVWLFRVPSQVFGDPIGFKIFHENC